jgi:hypothetical protein
MEHFLATRTRGWGRSIRIVGLARARAAVTPANVVTCRRWLNGRPPLA